MFMSTDLSLKPNLVLHNVVFFFHISESHAYYGVNKPGGAYLENDPVEAGREVGGHKRASLAPIPQPWVEFLGKHRRCLTDNRPKLGKCQLSNLTDAVTDWEEVCYGSGLRVHAQVENPISKLQLRGCLGRPLEGVSQTTR